MKAFLFSLFAVCWLSMTGEVRGDWVLVTSDVKYPNGMISSRGDVEEVEAHPEGWQLRCPDGALVVLPRSSGSAISADQAARLLMAQMLDYRKRLDEALGELDRTPASPVSSAARPMTSTERYQAKRRANEDRARADAAVAAQVSIANELSRLRQRLLVPNQTDLEIRELKRRIAELERSGR